MTKRKGNMKKVGSKPVKTLEETSSSDQEPELNSDTLDDIVPMTRKRRRKEAKSPRKKSEGLYLERNEEEGRSSITLIKGQEIVGQVVQAPKIGQVPPGQISQNTLDFLSQLSIPDNNDRQWFKLHEPVYREAEKEWKSFVEVFSNLLTTVDHQIPPLPTKDLIYRIYRDVRFSNDKTPYKTGLSASFSRSGRKGIFACYYIEVKPGDKSVFGAGSWCPARNELATIRSNLQRSSARLRRILSKPEFVGLFGDPRPRVDGGRQSIFGMTDELKTAPKGIDKDHRDIDLLKCRTFIVDRYFTDVEVLDPDFKTRLADLARIVRPFVHCLNDLMTIGGEDEHLETESEEENIG